MIVRSPFPDVEIPGSTITDYVARRWDEHPERPAFVDGASGRVVTFDALRARIARVAGGLVERGFNAGDVLAIMAPNCAEYAIAFHAAALAGGTVTTLNPGYTSDETRRQLADSGASVLVTTSELLRQAGTAVRGTSIRATYTVDEGRSSLDSIAAAPINQVPVDPAEHVAALPYSSGTTGMPKGVMLTHRNLVGNLEQCRALFAYEPGEVALAVLPFFHIYGMQVLMNGLLADGITVVTVPRFELGQALQLITREKVTRWFVVPPIVLALAKDPRVDEHDLSTLKVIFSGAAPLGADVGEEASARVGCAIVQGYGMTELSPVSHVTPVRRGRPGSAGLTVPNTECRIVGPEGNDLPKDEVGELWIRGPLVMSGYWRNPDATAATVDIDGWLHTGDLAYFDTDGYLYLVDRAKELIKYKGFQIAPAELEAMLLTHPAVADVAVVGVPDAEAGEAPKAFVVLAPHAATTADELISHVRTRLATYKQVRSIEFVEAIPKSPSGKILRRLLRPQSRA